MIVGVMVVCKSDQNTPKNAKYLIEMDVETN